MKKIHILKQYAVIWVPLTLIVVCAVCWKLVVPAAQWIADNVLFCPVYEATGLYCLGCGATRSVMAMLRGDLPLAFHSNPGIPLLLVCAVLYYIQKIFEAFGKRLRLVPWGIPFWVTFLVLQSIWAIIRNFVPAMQPV